MSYMIMIFQVLQYMNKYDCGKNTRQTMVQYINNINSFNSGTIEDHNSNNGNKNKKILKL